MIRESLIVIAVLTAHCARADSLEAILARMDDSAKKFKTVSANVHRVDFTAVLNQSSEENGQMRLKRSKNGIVGVLEFTGADARVVGFRDRTVAVYIPSANTVQRVDTGKYASSLDAYLLIAFGTATSAELKAAYKITAAGSETIDSEKTTRLELIPKSDEIKKVAAKIELWIPEGKTIAVREKITEEPSHNTLTFTYSDVKLNPSLPDASYELKIPSGVKTIQVK